MATSLVCPLTVLPLQGPFQPPGSGDRRLVLLGAPAPGMGDEGLGAAGSTRGCAGVKPVLRANWEGGVTILLPSTYGPGKPITLLIL